MGKSLPWAIDYQHQSPPYRLPPCPRCGSQPDVDKVEPWARRDGPAPWYALCYRSGDDEHCIAVTGVDRTDAERLWRAEVKKHTMYVPTKGKRKE
jgi:hypothetical protein